MFDLVREGVWMYRKKRECNVIKDLMVVNLSLCFFPLQIHQAGGQAGFEEGKVSFPVTTWKRYDPNLFVDGLLVIMCGKRNSL